MKIFNGRLATEDYMSSHSLTFSTPEMTLKKFALWLGEQISDSKTKDTVLRLNLYIEDRSEKRDSNLTNVPDFLPDVDETFKPTGAISTLYGGNHSGTDDAVSLDRSEKKYCINCGSTIKQSSRYCNKCGTVRQD
ncbi:MAG TPA: zinc ribbon domain-containing protein [Verrucomicrobiae bacterium]|nr:zinc ribbon domain-containing protein [Verrucomicrobiae bacterium]